MIRFAALTLLLGAPAATAAAQQSTAVSQITDATEAAIAATEASGEGITPPAQVSIEGDSSPETGQVATAGMPREEPTQVAPATRDARAPQPLSTPEEGRTGAVEAVDGEDRCDPASVTDRNSPECKRVIETRAAEFERKRRQLSPEERLLLEQQLGDNDTDIGNVTRRLAASGQSDDSLQAMGIAAIVLNRPEPVVRDEDKDPALDAAAEAIANFLLGQPPTP